MDLDNATRLRAQRKFLPTTTRILTGSLNVAITKSLEPRVLEVRALRYFTFLNVPHNKSHMFYMSDILARHMAKLGNVEITGRVLMSGVKLCVTRNVTNGRDGAVTGVFAWRGRNWNCREFVGVVQELNAACTDKELQRAYREANAAFKSAGKQVLVTSFEQFEMNRRAAAHKAN